MVVSSAINVPTRDLLVERKRSSTVVKNSLALSHLGSVDLILFAMLISIKIMLNLFDLSQDLHKASSSALLESVIAGNMGIKFQTYDLMTMNFSS
jgi:hypothetical protein